MPAIKVTCLYFSVESPVTSRPTGVFPIYLLSNVAIICAVCIICCKAKQLCASYVDFREICTDFSGINLDLISDNYVVVCVVV